MSREDERLDLLQHPPEPLSEDHDRPIKTLVDRIRQRCWNILHFRTSMARRRRRHHHHHHHRAESNVVAYRIELFVLSLIVMNVIVTIWVSIQMNPEENVIEYQFWYSCFLYFSTSVFSLEYLLRVWSCVEDPRFHHPVFGRLKWMMKPMAIVDIISIIPFYLELFLTESYVSMNICEYM